MQVKTFISIQIPTFIYDAQFAQTGNGLFAIEKIVHKNHRQRLGISRLEFSTAILLPQMDSWGLQK